MTHVFVAPHPDDAALSCGGLIANLRELGQNVTILTVYSGNGVAGDLTPYQREAPGFGFNGSRSWAMRVSQVLTLGGILREIVVVATSCPGVSPS